MRPTMNSNDPLAGVMIRIGFSAGQASEPVFLNTGQANMPTLIIEGVPKSLYDQIQRLADSRRQTPADAVLEVLKTAFHVRVSVLCDAPMPPQPFVTEEISAPCGIPRPKGQPAHPVRVAVPLPFPHDIPNEA